jgi:ribonuclease PH
MKQQSTTVLYTTQNTLQKQNTNTSTMQNQEETRVGNRLKQRKGKLRPLAAEVSCLKRADGSAKFTSGQTQVLAAVFGPVSPRIPSKERSSEAIISVVFKHGTKAASADNTNNALSGYGATERELERFVGGALSACVAVNKYPRTVIEVVIQVIKCDGSLASTALNSATLALMDAGVEMNSLPIGTTCAVRSNSASEENIIFDPCGEDELNPELSVIVLATDSIRDGVIGTMTLGDFHLNTYLSSIEGASRASKAVIAFMRIAIEQKVMREAKTLWSL